MSQASVLKQAREKAGLTQFELAKKMGLVGRGGLQHISNWERGCQGIPKKRVREFSRATGCTVESIIDVKVDDYRSQLQKEICEPV